MIACPNGVCLFKVQSHLESSSLAKRSHANPTLVNKDMNGAVSSHDRFMNKVQHRTEITPCPCILTQPICTSKVNI